MPGHYGVSVSSFDGELDRYEAQLTALLDGLHLELGAALERVEELTDPLYGFGGENGARCVERAHAHRVGARGQASPATPRSHRPLTSPPPGGPPAAPLPLPTAIGRTVSVSVRRPARLFRPCRAGAASVRGGRRSPRPPVAQLGSTGGRLCACRVLSHRPSSGGRRTIEMHPWMTGGSS